MFKDFMTMKKILVTPDNVDKWVSAVKYEDWSYRDDVFSLICTLCKHNLGGHLDGLPHTCSRCNCKGFQYETFKKCVSDLLREEEEGERNAS